VKKKADWFVLQDKAWARYAGERSEIRWPGASYAIADAAFRSGFAAGVRAAQRRQRSKEPSHGSHWQPLPPPPQESR